MLKKLLSCCITSALCFHSSLAFSQPNEIADSAELQQAPDTLPATLMLAPDDIAIADRYIVVFQQPQMMARDRRKPIKCDATLERLGHNPGHNRSVSAIEIPVNP